jgi:hypothetical protein
MSATLDSILARHRSRFTHYYFYFRDQTLGPMVMRVASFLPFQATYYLNGHSFIAPTRSKSLSVASGLPSGCPGSPAPHHRTSPAWVLPRHLG